MLLRKVRDVCPRTGGGGEGQDGQGKCAEKHTDATDGQKRTEKRKKELLENLGATDTPLTTHFVYRFPSKNNVNDSVVEAGVAHSSIKSCVFGV